MGVWVLDRHSNDACATRTAYSSFLVLGPLQHHLFERQVVLPLLATLCDLFSTFLFMNFAAVHLHFVLGLPRMDMHFSQGPWSHDGALRGSCITIAGSWIKVRAGIYKGFFFLNSSCQRAQRTSCPSPSSHFTCDTWKTMALVLQFDEFIRTHAATHTHTHTNIRLSWNMTMSYRIKQMESCMTSKLSAMFAQGGTGWETLLIFRC